jgi:hypothetical protein
VVHKKKKKKLLSKIQNDPSFLSDLRVLILGSGSGGWVTGIKLQRV